MKIEQIAKDYLADLRMKGYTEKTIWMHRNHLDRFILPRFGDKDISSIRLNDASFLIESASAFGKTVPRHTVITLRRLLRYAVRNGLRINFDWRDVEIPNIPLKPVIALTKDEIKLIREELEYAPQEYWAERRQITNKRNRALFELILHTGLRIGECIQANISDIDFLREEMTVQNIKTGEYDVVSLVGAMTPLRDYLKMRTDDNPALFVSCDVFLREGYRAQRLGKDGAKSISRLLDKRLKNRNFGKHFHWHMVRKTYVTILIESMIDLRSVQSCARHKSERTTLRHYAAFNKKRARELANRVMMEV